MGKPLYSVYQECLQSSGCSCESGEAMEDSERPVSGGEVNSVLHLC